MESYGLITHPNDSKQKDSKQYFCTKELEKGGIDTQKSGENIKFCFECLRLHWAMLIHCIEIK